MTCPDWESQLDAFADGELPAEETPALRAHIEECAHCRASLNTLRSLRLALVRRWASQAAPVGLADRVKQQVAAQDAVRSRSFDQSLVPTETGSTRPVAEHAAWNGAAGSAAFESVERSSSPSDARRTLSPRRRYLGLSLATLGTAVLAFALFRAFLPPPGAHREVTIVTDDRFSEIRRLHSDAVAARVADVGPGAASKKVSGIAEKLSSLADLRVLVPDLSADGYDFLNADLVEIQAVPAAQAVYRSPKAGILSVFTVRRMEKLGTPEPRRGIRSVFASTLNKTSVVGWHDGNQTYALCADLEQEALFRLVDQLPMAGRGLFGSMRDLLATTMSPGSRLAGRAILPLVDRPMAARPQRRQKNRRRLACDEIVAIMRSRTKCRLGLACGESHAGNSAARMLGETILAL